MFWDGSAWVWGRPSWAWDDSYLDFPQQIDVPIVVTVDNQTVPVEVPVQVPVQVDSKEKFGEGSQINMIALFLLLVLLILVIVYYNKK